jgi:hypothetical protein
VTNNPLPIKLGAAAPKSINGGGGASVIHPMKGPMTTQTLRGLVNHGPMHWRGDRVSGFFGTDQSTAPPYDSQLAFKNFIVAFNSLNGLGPNFSATDMQTLTDFALAIAMPPNPVRALDDSLTVDQAAGRSFFLGCGGPDSLSGQPTVCPDGGPIMTGGHLADGIPAPNLGFTCQGCHVLDPANGFFGTDGKGSFEDLPQTMKIPQLRNLYDKVGMFGEPPSLKVHPGNNGPTGAQVRGTGYTNEGSVDTIFRFLSAEVFDDGDAGVTGFIDGDPQRRQVEQYLLAFDSDLAPIVGQQVTLRSDHAASAGPRIDLLIARAGAAYLSKLSGPGATECQLVARTALAGHAVTYVFADGSFHPDDGSAVLADAAVRALAATAGQEVTYTCLPPGWGNKG